MFGSKSLLFVALGLSYVVANNCGGNCPSGRCTTCHCGTSQNHVDIASWCAKHNWSQACCQCVVKHESGGNAHAELHNTNGSDDVGLWQVNSMNWEQCNGDHAPCDVNQNLQCAIKVYNWGGHTWKLWSTCGACGCCSRAEEEAHLLREQEEALRLAQETPALQDEDFLQQ